MLDDVANEQSIEELARTDLGLACEKAREFVAANPNDEAAAVLLRDVVAKLVAAQEKRERKVRDLVGAAPDVREAAHLLDLEDQEGAELLLRKHLSVHRNDPVAMRFMAEIAARCGYFDNAERIARRALEIDQKSIGLRLTLARILFYHREDIDLDQRGEVAVRLLDEALDLEPDNAAALNLKGNFLVHMRRQEPALAALTQALSIDPFYPAAWITMALIHKTLGQVGRAVAAFRTALAMDPSISHAWWELANLKTVDLFASDTPLIAEALAKNSELGKNQQAELHFTLFTAYDDIGDTAQAAEHLIAANDLKRELHPYDASAVSEQVDRAIADYTREFFQALRNGGSDSDEMIFVLGMYRAGSTLVEQILSSHSKVEGTAELFYLLEMVDGIASTGKDPADFLATASQTQLEGLAGKMLELGRSHKRTKRPYFIDKNPVNWPHVGIIHALLPNARIIDVRRNPLDCCFANYAQNFDAGVAFSYDQSDVANYYADYLRMMRHFEPLLPGRYHRVIYEELVDEPEREIRRLLQFLGMDFEPSCLRFFETERPIYTPSAQQVRQPINRSGIGRWRPYESWLKPLIEALGDLPETYAN